MWKNLSVWFCWQLIMCHNTPNGHLGENMMNSRSNNWPPLQSFLNAEEFRMPAFLK